MNDMNEIKLSILILTHNRPSLFKRCIGSALLNKPDYVEIIVNNDSDDIEEISGAKYYYEKYDDLSDVYNFLFNKANGEFIYFLEDDDYLTSNFYKMIDLSYDINYMNYIHWDEYKFVRKYLKPIYIEEVNYQFQLGQILFRKKLVSSFPKGNILHNDWNLFQSIKESGTLKLINSKMFVQTHDGNDNISSTLYGTNERFK